MHNLVILGGNPGSGKSTISKLLEKQNFVHLEIDAFYQRAPRTPGIENWFEDQAFLDAAYAEFKKEILKNIAQGNKIVIETAGFGIRWKALFAELESIASDKIVTIYLDTSRETSLERINARNKTDHPIKMTEERLDNFLMLGKDTKNVFQHVVDANGSIDEVFEAVLGVV